MGAKDRQHYIPQFLLRRFASRVDKKRGTHFIFQHRKGSSSPIEISIRDAAVATQFYGNASIGIEDRLTNEEGKFDGVLRALDLGASVSDYREEIGRFIWLHVVRTRALRESFEHAFGSLLTKIGASFAGDEAKNAFKWLVEEQLEAVVDHAIAQNAPMLTSSERRKLAIQAMSGGGRRQMTDALRNSGSLESGLTLIAAVLASPAFKNTMAKKLEDAHTRSLARLLDEHLIPDTIRSADIRVVATDDEPFILGDCCAFVVSSSGAVQPVGRDLVNMQALYFPISKMQVVVVGRTEEQRPLTPAEINDGSAACSQTCCFSSIANDVTLNLKTRVGEQAHVVTPDYLDEIIKGFDWKDALMKSLKPKHA